MTTLNPDDLRQLFLFEKLDQDQLEWLAPPRVIQPHAGGAYICVEGHHADLLDLLLSRTK